MLDEENAKPHPSDIPRSKIIYVTPEQYAAVDKEPVGPTGKLKPDRLAQLIGRDKMLQIMHASMHSLPVELRARKTPNK